MRRPGRPNGGVAHVDRLHGDGVGKDRLRLIVKTFTGDLTVQGACTELAISRSRFQQLRGQMLEFSRECLEPGRPGRPAKSESHATAAEVAALRAEIARLERELAMARAQAELATRLRGTEALSGGSQAARARLAGRPVRRR